MTKYMGRDPIQHIRIQGKPNDKKGYDVTIYDASTNEAIGNIFEIIVLLNAKDINKAIVTYYKVNESGSVESVKQLVEITEELSEPEIDIAALPVPARVLMKVAELWRLAESLARMDIWHQKKGCPFCDDDLPGHKSQCPIKIAVELTRAG